MKLVSLALLFSVSSFAGVSTFEGSGTVKEVMNEAIHKAKLQDEIVFLASSSGKSAQAVVDGKQGIATTTNPIKKEAVEAARKKGIEFVEHVIGLDGVAILVNTANKTTGLSLELLGKIFSCQITKWEDIPDSKLKGEIKAYRHDDTSGTSDFFKSKTGNISFGSCAVIVNDLNGEIGKSVSTEKNGIGFTSLASRRAKNRVAAIAAKEGEKAFVISNKTVQSGEYPFSRKLYFYEASGSAKPNDAEAKLAKKILDPKFLNKILVKNNFFALPTK